MEYTDIITAAISAAAAVAGSMLANNKTMAVLQTKLDSLKEDVKKLSTRVDKHNSVVERMTVAECKIEELEKRGEK